MFGVLLSLIAATALAYMPAQKGMPASSYKSSSSRQYMTIVRSSRSLSSKSVRSAMLKMLPTGKSSKSSAMPSSGGRHGAAASSVAERNPAAYAGVYLGAGSMGRDEFLEQTMKSVGESGGNTIIFDVKGSRVFFDGDTPMADELGLVHNSYDLDSVIKKARERGIYTMGRFVALKDSGLASVKPSTLVRLPKTGVQIQGDFVDADNADVLEYNRQAICTLAKSGIDEINLDYIRFSTANFGALYQFSTEEKTRKITRFVQMARDTIDECGPKTKLGISTFAILGWNYDVNVATLGQAIPELSDIVDIVSPMAYPATFAAGSYYSPGKHPISRMYYLVWRTLDGYKPLMGEENVHKLRPWIQGYGVDTKDMQDQMKAVHDAGVCGFTVWNANNNYGPTYKALPSWEYPEGC
jgi:hypothetical protein